MPRPRSPLNGLRGYFIIDSFAHQVQRELLVVWAWDVGSLGCVDGRPVHCKACLFLFTEPVSFPVPEVKPSWNSER